jgi:hypothetical protein
MSERWLVVRTQLRATGALLLGVAAHGIVPVLRIWFARCRSRSEGLVPSCERFSESVVFARACHESLL